MSIPWVVGPSVSHGWCVNSFLLEDIIILWGFGLSVSFRSAFILRLVGPIRLFSRYVNALGGRSIRHFWRCVVLFGWLVHQSLMDGASIPWVVGVFVCFGR